MDVHTPLTDFVELCANLGKNKFQERFHAPFLVVELGGVPRSLEDFKTYAMRPEERKPTSHGLGNGIPPETVAVPLVKAGRNTFHDKITIGRAANNDVVVPHPSVSKLHALIKAGSVAGAYLLSDVGSTYGTKVNGRKLAKLDAHTLASGDTILLAESVRVTYFTLPDFFEYLQLVKRAGTP